MATISTFGNYWSNNFADLKCVYEGANVDESPIAWSNRTLAYETNLLSHVCLNGSFSDLSYDEWNEHCFPSYKDNVVWRQLAGFWYLVNFIVGTLGNLLTLMSVAYARKHNR